MSAELTKRATRRDPAGTRVTPRDLLALRFIAAAQPATTSQVRGLLGLSEDMAHRRLAVLRDHGLVRVYVGALHESNRYSLAPGAAPVLARLSGGSPEDFWIPRGIDRQDLAHHEAAVDLYVKVQLATARSKNVRLARWLFERDVRRATGAGSAGALVPDAVGLFEFEDGTARAIAFEVDLGTENPSYVATHKGEAYAQLKAAGSPMLGTTDWRVACYVHAPERRLHRLGLALAEATVPTGLWYLGLASRLDDRSILAPTWVTPVVDQGAGTATLLAASPWAGVGTKGRNCSDGFSARQAGFEADRSPMQGRAFTSERVP